MEGTGVPNPFPSSASVETGRHEPVPLTTSERFHVWRHSAGGEDAALVWLLDKIVAGESLNALCVANEWSYTTVARWLRAEPARQAAYDLACEDRAIYHAELILEVSRRDCTAPVLDNKGTFVGTRVDPGKVAQAKLEADNLKWIASKMNRRYADRVDVNAQVDLKSVSDDALVAQLSAFGLGGVAREVLAGRLPVAGGNVLSGGPDAG